MAALPGHPSRHGVTTRQHVLGLNRREIELITPKNPRQLILGIAGDKVATKRLLASRGIPVPKTYAVLDSRRALQTFDWSLPDDFALKPSGGGRGCGIVVVTGRDGSRFVAFGDEAWSRERLSFHVLGILEGDFTREGRADIAQFEQRMRTTTDLFGHPTASLPDVRIIVCEGRAIMAMTRIPTLESRGNANLHQGAEGVGIDVHSGLTRAAVCNGELITRHPETGAELVGIRVAGFQEFVAIAMAAADASGLGYTGIDLVIDDVTGPAVLEINARPGLDIQLANLSGLRAALAL